MNDTLTTIFELSSSAIGSEWSSAGAIIAFMIWLVKRVMRQAQKDVGQLHQRFNNLDARNNTIESQLSELRSLRERDIGRMRDVEKMQIETMDRVTEICERVESCPNLANGRA
jgi:hypothetical protein